MGGEAIKHMFIGIDGAHLKALMDWLNSSPDSEREGEGYVADFYESTPPLSMEILPAKGGIEVLAALTLMFDDESEGWYLGEKIKDAEILRSALLSAALE